MKEIRYILLLSVVCLAFCLTSRAQTIEVDDSTDFVVVRYSFPMSKPRSAYSLTFTPQICGQNDTLRLQSILVRGRDNEKITHRYYVLNHRQAAEPDYIQGKRMGKDAVYNDTIRINAKRYPWVMTDSLSLCVKVLEEGCCNAEFMPALLSAAKAPLHEPVEPIDTVQYAQIDTVAADTVDTVPPFIPNFADIDTFEPDSFAAQLVRNNPVAIQFKDYKPYDKTVVLAKDSGALYVHFPLDKIVLLREFSNNAATLDRIMYMINSLMEDTTTAVKVIQIIGLASIEGNVPHNEWLAQNRGNALRDYIKQRIDTTGIEFEVAGGGEAWTEFEWLVQQDNFEGKQRVLEIIKTVPDLNKREAWLKSLNNGRTWAYIKQHILPPLRNSGYVRVYYEVKPDKNGITINEATALLRQERYAEALEKLLQVRDDERAQNALGVAYYMTGDRENAIRCWRRAAANGDKDAFNNLQHVLIEGVK
ncbi:MAG: hypothetical protein IKN91_00600 [Paludibacteraceae bacterium]|nr:hypothetical protein [Paludibacteraceae bacterium]